MNQFVVPKFSFETPAQQQIYARHQYTIACKNGHVNVPLNYQIKISEVTSFRSDPFSYFREVLFLVACFTAIIVRDDNAN